MTHRNLTGAEFRAEYEAELAAKVREDAGKIRDVSRVAFEPFLALVRSRLEAGAREYGDRSLAAPLPATLAEIEEELADVCGWAAVAFVRIQRLRAAAEAIEVALAQRMARINEE